MNEYTNTKMLTNTTTKIEYEIENTFCNTRLTTNTAVFSSFRVTKEYDDGKKWHCWEEGRLHSLMDKMANIMMTMINIKMILSHDNNGSRGWDRH